MARTVLAVQKIERSGIVPAFTAANADGHSIINDGETFLYVKNGAAAPINVTILTPGTVDGLAVSDRVVAVANGAEKMIGPFPKASYDQPGTDVFHVDFSAVATITVGAFRL